MWTKDDYQDHMMGYLDGVRTEIERLARASRQWRNLDEFYSDLDFAFECLQRLIKAGDTEWEAFRYTLEASCDVLLRGLYRVPHTGVLIFSRSFTVTERDEKLPQSWQQVAVL
jgi:hypothetical protein